MAKNYRGMTHPSIAAKAYNGKESDPENHIFCKFVESEKEFVQKTSRPLSYSAISLKHLSL